MIRTTKVYIDKRTGGIRIYIPQEMVSALAWGDHTHVILKQHDSKLKISLEKDGYLDEDEYRQKEEIGNE